MTLYCTATDVRMTVDTELKDDVLEELIEEAGAEIERKIGVQSTSDKNIKKLCRYMVALDLQTTKPRSIQLGELRISMRDTIKSWEKEIEELFKLYDSVVVKKTDYQHIDEEVRYSED